jgi:hypothetical protein
MNKFVVEFTVIEETFGTATFEGEDMTQDEAESLLEDYIGTHYPNMTEYSIDRVKGSKVAD